MKYRSRFFKWIAGGIWGLLCIWSLYSFLSHEQAWLDSELMQLVYLKMIVLTFPVGYSVVLLASVLSEFLQTFLSVHIGAKVEFFFSYLFMFSAGFVQWFIFLPWLLKGIFCRNQRR